MQKDVYSAKGSRHHNQQQHGRPVYALLVCRKLTAGHHIYTSNISYRYLTHFLKH